MSARNDFGKLAQDVQRRASLVLDTFQAEFVSRAKVHAPVDTGNLRNSIQPQGGARELERRVMVGAEYGIHQEFGTVRQSGTPFMRPTGSELAAPFREAAAKVLKP